VKEIRYPSRVVKGERGPHFKKRGQMKKGGMGEKLSREEKNALGKKKQRG